MKHLRTIFTLGGVAFILATVAFLTNTWATEDVRNSKHNLTTNPDIMAQGITEVCVFCHTPHGGLTNVAGGAAPIWNRNLSAATYTLYDSPNFDGKATVTQPQGVSVACLSCHDGTVAFDSLLNFSGSGSTNNITGFSPTSGTPRVDTTTRMMINSGAQEYPMLGTNLSNDHPVSMEIPCTTDPQFSQICVGIAADSARLLAGKVSYLSRSGDFILIPDGRDRIRAYPTVAGKAYIECASCHNPHENTSTRFLRHPSIDGTVLPLPSGITAAQLNSDRNAGSLLCLSCHQK
ncbi:MAG: hypothetical protein HZC13_03935 [Nitrospirae bacterium]|nr:hypothetical protein [Nitrospirota bacterium]MBI5096385.1 hypothetical protein [Nitrospirota bacterium]